MVNMKVWTIRFGVPTSTKLSKWQKTEQRCELLLESCPPPPKKKTGFVFPTFSWLVISIFLGTSEMRTRGSLEVVCSNVETTSFHFNASALVSKTGQ